MLVVSLLMFSGCAELASLLEEPEPTLAEPAPEAEGSATEGTAQKSVEAPEEPDPNRTGAPEVTERPDVWPPVTIPQGPREGSTRFEGVKRKGGRVIDLGNGETFDPSATQ